MINGHKWWEFAIAIGTMIAFFIILYLLFPQVQR